MRKQWTAEEIHDPNGLYIVRNSYPVGSENYGFGRSVTYKVGWDLLYGELNVNHGLIANLTDGMFHRIGTCQDVADYLNKDEYGYRPLTKKEYINFINSSNQGFIL